MVLCNFVDVGLRYQPEREIDPTRVIDRLGGVIAATAGSVMIFGGTITRVSALPNDLQLSSCLQVWSQHAAMSHAGVASRLRELTLDFFCVARSFGRTMMQRQVWRASGSVGSCRESMLSSICTTSL